MKAEQPLQRERDIPCARGRAFLTQQVTDKIGSTSASHSHPTHATRQTSTPSDAPLSSAPLNPQPNAMETKTTNMQPHLENDIVQRLQEENAASKVELQALRSTTQLQAPLSIAHASHEQTFDFLKLPRELRSQVYELCVVVGKVHIARPIRLFPADMRYQSPRDAAALVSLFAVNKLIRLESLELYLSKNQFIIMVAEQGLSANVDGCPLNQIPGYMEPEVFANLRSVSVSLDRRDSRQFARYCVKDSTHHHLFLDSPEEIQSIAEYHNDNSLDLYYDLCSTLFSLITSSTQLREIQVNLQNTACGLGCHRMVVSLSSSYQVKLHLLQFALKAQRIESLDFLGAVNHVERQTIRSAFPAFIRKKITFHGQFDCSWCTWDPDAEIHEAPSEHGAPDSASEDSFYKDHNSE